MFFFFKQKTAYEMRISDWSSDVCSSDLLAQRIKEADFIVPDAVKARPGGKAGCGDVQNAPAQLQEASSARPCCAQPQLRHLVAAPVMVLDRPVLDQIGRASCRERVCPYVSVSVVAVSLKKKKIHHTPTY